MRGEFAAIARSRVAVSAADIQATQVLRRLLREVGVLLVDHLVIVDGDMVSMAQSGYMQG